MTYFTSGKIKHDLEPYVRTYNGTDECRISATLAGRQGSRFENGFGEVVQTRYAPRSEFDHHNPILAEFRSRFPWNVQEAARIEADWLQQPGARPIPEDATPAQIDHARRVLSKLANVY